MERNGLLKKTAIQYRFSQFPTLDKDFFRFHEQIEVGGVPLTAVRETFDITPSPPPTVSTATGDGPDNGDFVLILAGGGAVFAVGFSVLLVGVAWCLVCQQKKRRKRKDKVKKVGHNGSFSQFPRLQPTSKVLWTVSLFLHVRIRVEQ